MGSLIRVLFLVQLGIENGHFWNQELGHRSDTENKDHKKNCKYVDEIRFALRYERGI